MRQIYLVARREYLAYVRTWGFWISLFTAPVLLAALLFGPVLLARAEPSRAIVVLAEQADDAALVRAAFEKQARDNARAEIKTYLEAAAPNTAPRALAAFDAAPSAAAAGAAARAVVVRDAPAALRAFPGLSPRYVIAAPPADNIEALKPYLIGRRALPDGRPLYGAIHVRRVDAQPRVDYWSVNLSQREPADIAQRAMRAQMQRETIAGLGLAPSEADRLDGLSPDVAQFDPRPTAAAGGQVTLRERAPFYAAIMLTFILWSVVFSVANMLLSGVLEEKSNKILDSLLTSVAPLQLLVGKLIGVACVSATLLGLWAALGGGLLSAAAAHAGQGVLGQIAAAFLDTRLLTAFAIGFSVGYLLYGAIFLAIGSLCESLQEAQSLMGPVALVLAVPMMLLAPALDNPNAPMIAAASWFPLFTPFLILIRAPSNLSWTEIAGMSAMMGAALIVVLVMAARVFHAGVVHQLSLTSLFRKKEK
ncbi:MAG TPA: ABC transporter permease [Caulobacterales bacterium]|nr:ABC transporter permease [Caulobacterales bacterium]